MRKIKDAVENVKNESVTRMEMDAYAKVEHTMFHVAKIKEVAKVINDKKIINECNYISDVSSVLLICIKGYYEMQSNPKENNGRFEDVQNYTDALYVSLENIINSANLCYENILDDILENVDVAGHKPVTLDAYKNILCLSTEAKDIVSSITFCEW